MLSCLESPFSRKPSSLVEDAPDITAIAFCLPLFLLYESRSKTYEGPHPVYPTHSVNNWQSKEWRTGGRIHGAPQPSAGQAWELLPTCDSLFPGGFYLLLRLWKLLSRTSIFVWRFYLLPSPRGVICLPLSSQAFLCCQSPAPQLFEWWSLASWTEGRSYSVISPSFRATDQREQQQQKSTDWALLMQTSQWLCSFLLCLKFLIWPC